MDMNFCWVKRQRLLIGIITFGRKGASRMLAYRDDVLINTTNVRNLKSINSIKREAEQSMKTIL